MADEKGPVHYQISITGGQAGAFFLTLLVALSLAFFFGMKTGAAARKAPSTEARLAAASDIQSPKDDQGGAAADDASTSGPRGAAPEPTLGVAEAAETKTRREARKAVAPEVEEKEARPTAEPRAERVEKTVTAEKVESPSPTAVPVASKANGSTAPAKEDGPWFVQVAAVQNPTAADDTVKRLKAAGFASDISTVTTAKGELFRVRVGPFPDRAAADAASQKVQAAERLKEKPIVVPASR